VPTLIRLEVLEFLLTAGVPPLSLLWICRNGEVVPFLIDFGRLVEAQLLQI
jgi:hypothetical protein